jgi:predicted aspartyl protease
VIRGVVTENGSPIVNLPVAGRDWATLVDSGFNGDLELPEALRSAVNARFAQVIVSELAGGQHVVEDSYWVDFSFDGKTVTAVATFVPGDGILLGTGLLGDYRLEINFRAGTVVMERTATP